MLEFIDIHIYEYVLMLACMYVFFRLDTFTVCHILFSYLRVNSIFFFLFINDVKFQAYGINKLMIIICAKIRFN